MAPQLDARFVAAGDRPIGHRTFLDTEHGGTLTFVPLRENPRASLLLTARRDWRRPACRAGTT